MILRGCADAWLWDYIQKRERYLRRREKDPEAARAYTAAMMRAMRTRRKAELRDVSEMRTRRKAEPRDNLIRAVYWHEVRHPFAPMHRFKDSVLLVLAD
jgi:hypothetical protein